MTVKARVRTISNKTGEWYVDATALGKLLTENR